MTILKTDSTATVSNECFKNFKTAGKVSVVVPRFIQLAWDVSVFYKSVENSIMCICMFRKVTLLDYIEKIRFKLSCRLTVYIPEAFTWSKLTTEELEQGLELWKCNFWPGCCNVTKNKLLTKFCRRVLKFTENIQEELYNIFPFK